MSIAPVVRYMILCNDWEVDASNQRQVNIYGLLSNIWSKTDPPFPATHPSICVFLALVAVRGVGHARIKTVYEETGDVVFETPAHLLQGVADPLQLLGVPFRIHNCNFPRGGAYQIQFWYNDLMVHECPLHVRSAS